MVFSESASTFETATVPDTQPPSIDDGPTVLSVTDTTAVIHWTTDEIADTRVNYGLQGQPLSLTCGDIADEFEHTAVLTNLAPAATYSFQVASEDASGNGPATAGGAFTTSATPDTASPEIDSVLATAQPKEVLVTWSTDEASTSQVVYGSDVSDLNRTANVEGMTTEHSVTLAKLRPERTYYFKVVSEDLDGNAAEVGIFMVRTLDSPTSAGTWDDYR